MKALTPFQQAVLEGIPKELPEAPVYEPSVSHAPKRVITGVLSDKEKLLAVKNALRYFDKKHHARATCSALAVPAS